MIKLIKKLFSKSEIMKDEVKPEIKPNVVKDTIAQQLHKVSYIEQHIENIIEDAFEEYEPEIYRILDYSIGSDYYDNSIEIYIKVSLPYPYEPCKEVRDAVYALGFSNVYWNFNKDCMEVICDRIQGNPTMNSPDEIRNWEPRHNKYTHWIHTKYGYVDNRFNEKDWLTKYNFRGK